MAQRPRRERKADTLICPGATAAEIACDYAIAPFDRVARDMDREWGVDRLPELVRPALASRFGAAMAHLNDCIGRGDAAACAAAAENCIKGMRAMDAEARAAGHRPLPADVWIYELEGRRFGVVREAGDWTTLQESQPGLTIYSLREVAIALQSYKSALPIIEAAKAAFPGAQITAVRSKLAEDLEDEIPF